MVKVLQEVALSPFYQVLKNEHPEKFTGKMFICSCDAHEEEFTFKAFIQDDKTEEPQCPKCQQEKIDSNAAEEQLKYKIRCLIERFNVPADNAHAVFDDFEIRTDEGAEIQSQDKAALTACKSMVVKYSFYEEPYKLLRNVTLCGKTGNGKSFLGAALIQNCTELKISCFYIADSTLLSKVTSCWKSKTKENEELRKQFESYKVLVIDDVDPERWQAAKSTFLADLLIQRYDNLKQTLILSNRTREDIFAGFGSAVESRLRRGRIVTLTGEDRRKKQKMKELSLYET